MTFCRAQLDKAAKTPSEKSVAQLDKAVKAPSEKSIKVCLAPRCLTWLPRCVML